MERKEAERMMLDKLEEIVEIAKEYFPDLDYLMLTHMKKNDYFSVSNDYYNHTEDGGTVYAAKWNGEYHHDII